MNDRERLIELCDTMTKMCRLQACGFCKYNSLKPCCISEAIADTMIANGVIMPPVSLGDKIYEIISPKDREPYFITATVCAVHIADGSRNSCQRKRESYIVAECQGTKYVHKYPFSKFGKTVFSNLEDAERALKEREEQCNAPTANANSPR